MTFGVCEILQHAEDAYLSNSRVQAIAFGQPTQGPPGKLARYTASPHADPFWSAMDSMQNRLRDWLLRPQDFEDDDYEFPSQTTILRAMKLLSLLHPVFESQPWSRPSGARGVGIDSGGTISLEFGDYQHGLTFRVLPGDSRIEQLVFHRDRLVQRVYHSI